MTPEQQKLTEQFNTLKQECYSTQYGYENNVLSWVKLCELAISLGNDLADCARRVECQCDWSITTDPSDWSKSIKTRSHQCERCRCIEAWDEASIKSELMDGDKYELDSIREVMRKWQEDASKLAALFPGLDWSSVSEFVPLVQSLRAELAALKSPKGYEEELSECEAKVAALRAEGDTHGANFYEGMWSGIVRGDIIQTKAKEALRAELAEAKAQFEKARQWNELTELELKNLRSIVEEQNADILSLQSHNAKLREALEDAESDLRCYEGDPKYPAKNRTLKLVRAALASHPDNELRDRVVKVLKGLQAYGDNLLGVDRHAITELISSL